MSRIVRNECLRRARSRWPHDPPAMGDVRSPEDEVLRRLDAEQVAKAISALPRPPAANRPSSRTPTCSRRSTRTRSARFRWTTRPNYIHDRSRSWRPPTASRTSNGATCRTSRRRRPRTSWDYLRHTADLHLKVRRTFHRWQRSRCSDSRSPAGALVALAAANTTPILIVPYKAPQRAGARSGSAYGERHQLRCLAFLPFAKIRTAAG